MEFQKICGKPEIVEKMKSVVSREIRLALKLKLNGCYKQFKGSARRIIIQVAYINKQKKIVASNKLRFKCLCEGHKP